MTGLPEGSTQRTNGLFLVTLRAGEFVVVIAYPTGHRVIAEVNYPNWVVFTRSRSWRHLFNNFPPTKACLLPVRNPGSPTTSVFGRFASHCLFTSARFGSCSSWCAAVTFLLRGGRFADHRVTNRQVYGWFILFTAE